MPPREKKKPEQEQIVPRKVEDKYAGARYPEFYSLFDKNFGSDASRFDCMLPDYFDVMLGDPNPEADAEFGRTYKFEFYSVRTEDISKILESLKDTLNTLYWNNKLHIGNGKYRWCYAEFQSIHYETFREEGKKGWSADGLLTVNIRLGEAVKKLKE